MLRKLTLFVVFVGSSFSANAALVDYRFTAVAGAGSYSSISGISVNEGDVMTGYFSLDDSVAIPDAIDTHLTTLSAPSGIHLRVNGSDISISELSAYTNAYNGESYFNLVDSKPADGININGDYFDHSYDWNFKLAGPLGYFIPGMVPTADMLAAVPNTSRTRLRISLPGSRSDEQLDFIGYNVAVQAVPLPSALCLFGSALAALLGYRRTGTRA